MKKKLITFVLFVSIMVCYSFTVVTKTNEIQTDKKVELEKKSYGSTRSATTTVVSAFTDNYTVSVFMENYDGFVSVEVTGAGGAAQQSGQITGSGQMVLDISPFNAGSYTLRVILGNTVYEGSFEKL